MAVSPSATDPRRDKTFVPAGVGIRFSHRRGKRSPARRDKLSRRVRLKWSRRNGSLTIDIRGVDPPLRVPPVSGDPVSDERNAPSPPAPPPTRGEGRRLEAGRALGVLGLRCAPTQAIAVAPCWGLENSGRDTKTQSLRIPLCLGALYVCFLKQSGCNGGRWWKGC